MWADTARHQIVRFEQAMDTYRAGQADYAFRAAVHERGGPTGEWAASYDQANRYLTTHEIWSVGAERYFLLLALAQLRKCVLRLPADELPALQEHKVLMFLRDVDEHWEQIDTGRSLRELRKSKPYLDAGPGRFWSNRDDIWFGDTPLAEISTWVDDVDQAVRDRAEAAGLPIPKADLQLPDYGPGSG